MLSHFPLVSIKYEKANKPTGAEYFSQYSAWLKPSQPAKIIWQSARSFLNSYMRSRAIYCEVFTSARVEDCYKQSYYFP